jgi:hypothetical protein
MPARYGALARTAPKSLPGDFNIAVNGVMDFHAQALRLRFN